MEVSFSVCIRRKSGVTPQESWGVVGIGVFAEETAELSWSQRQAISVFSYLLHQALATGISLIELIGNNPIVYMAGADDDFWAWWLSRQTN